MGYAVRTQGWLLIQWTADWRDTSARAQRAACEAHFDLFRVQRNASRIGILLEQIVPPRTSGRLPHAALVQRLRRRLGRAVPKAFTMHAQAGDVTE